MSIAAGYHTPSTQNSTPRFSTARIGSVTGGAAGAVVSVVTGGHSFRGTRRAVAEPVPSGDTSLGETGGRGSDDAHVPPAVGTVDDRRRRGPGAVRDREPGSGGRAADPGALRPRAAAGDGRRLGGVLATRGHRLRCRRDRPQRAAY